MLNKSVLSFFLCLVLGLASLAPPPAIGQDAPAAETFSTEQLDQMLAPIALYPDEVLSNVLMASTYPLDVVQASRWRKEAANKKLKGDALDKALEGKTWDPSVKALTLFPEVLGLMSDQLEWTQNLGDAFLAQEDAVFARVQFLRQKAEAAGTLKSNKEQTVTKKKSTETAKEYIVIQPARPEYVYVPVYQPSVVYGTWWYPAYPPYYWNWYPGASFVNGLFWGAGFAVANNIWGWNNCNWNHNHIDINVNHYNRINVNRPPISNNQWVHDAKHRGPVPYRDKATREKFAKDDPRRDKKKDFGGYEEKVGATRDKLKDKGPDFKDKADFKDKPGFKDKDLKDKADFKDKGRDIDKLKDKRPDRDGPKTKDLDRDRDFDRPKTKDLAKPANKKFDKPASKALDVKPKADVMKHVDRGSASRAKAMSHPKARAGGGGGGMNRGGGGGRGGGRGGRR